MAQMKEFAFVLCEEVFYKCNVTATSRAQAKKKLAKARSKLDRDDAFAGGHIKCAVVKGWLEDDETKSE